MNERNILPNRRYADTMGFEWMNKRHTITVGYYMPSKKMAEVFINMNKAQSGTELEAIARDGAILLSIAFQHGCDISTIHHAITRTQQGEPCTVIGAVVDRMVKEVEK
jgi:hypothetical protein